MGSDTCIPTAATLLLKLHDVCQQGLLSRAQQLQAPPAGTMRQMRSPEKPCQAQGCPPGLCRRGSTYYSLLQSCRKGKTRTLQQLGA